MKYYTNENLAGIKGQVTYYNDRLQHTIIELVPPISHQLTYERSSSTDISVYNGTFCTVGGRIRNGLLTVIDGRANNNREELFDYKMTDKQLQILSRPTFTTGSGYEYDDAQTRISLRGSHDYKSMDKLQELGLVRIHQDGLYATVKGRLAGIGLNLSLAPMDNILRFDGSPYLMNKETAKDADAQMNIKSFLYFVELDDSQASFNADYDKLEKISKDQPTLDDVLFIREERERDLRIKLSRSEMAKTDAHHKNYLLSNRISEFVDMLKGLDEEDHNLSVTWDTKAGKSWLKLEQFEEQFIRINEVMHGAVKIETFNHLAK